MPGRIGKVPRRRQATAFPHSMHRTAEILRRPLCGARRPVQQAAQHGKIGMLQKDRNARRRRVLAGGLARLRKRDLRPARPRNKPGAGSGETKTLFAKTASVSPIRASSSAEADCGASCLSMPSLPFSRRAFAAGPFTAARQSSPGARAAGLPLGRTPVAPAQDRSCRNGTGRWNARTPRGRRCPARQSRTRAPGRRT